MSRLLPLSGVRQPNSEVVLVTPVRKTYCASPVDLELTAA